MSIDKISGKLVKHKHKYGDISDPTSSGYLGTYATLTDLQTAYPTANDKDYAFVAGKIYKYTSTGWGIAYETGGETASNFRDYVMQASGSNPAAGNLRMFAKTIKRMFTRDSSGVEALVCDESGWQPEFQGVACDGVDDYISIADNANLNFPATPFMQEFFVKMPTDITTSQYISFKGTNSFSVLISLGNLTIQKAGSGAWVWGSVPISGYAGKLLHVVAGWDGTNRVVYLNGQLVQSAAQSTNLIETNTTTQSIGSSAGVNIFKGSIYLARFWNLALTATEVLQLYNNGQPQNSVILSKYRGASQTIRTSGTLTVGKQYQIVNYVLGDSFTNVGAASNATGVTFVATGTTPTAWTNASQLKQIGAVLELKGENMGHVSAIDTSGNRLHGAMNGTPTLTVNPLQQKATTGVFTTNIAAGTANKDIIIPAGYYVTAITVANTLSAGNLTNIQAVLDPTGDNITLITGKTVNNAKTLTFTALADQTQSTSSRVVRVNATGNGTGGMEVMLILARRD